MFKLISSGLALGVLGILLLLVARWPLYRQRRFWTLGPRELPPRHRRIWLVAYAAVIPAMGLLAAVWLRPR